MTEAEFVSAIRRMVEESWEERAWLAWFTCSAALLGARIGVKIKTGQWL